MQHDRHGRGLQHFAVGAAVVLGILRHPREVAGRHQHRARAFLLLCEVQLLLVGVDHVVERDVRFSDVIGVDSDDDGSTLFTCDLRAAGDELAGGLGVQAHVALRRVHRVGDTEAPGVDVAAER